MDGVRFPHREQVVTRGLNTNTDRPTTTTTRLHKCVCLLRNPGMEKCAHHHHPGGKTPHHSICARNKGKRKKGDSFRFGVGLTRAFFHRRGGKSIDRS
ncbi:hypothetical protein ZHAS_00007376 [Anopheles sinensis]|uniref:Uncharacterized protein n=1 Tax=Anopheles sinensis TaxID=74873 RepID=A0A084VPU4_ANOSI|nr:hypothetical protein ZHAS_00007376 [Anopheles sinensis]